ncbi:MAG: hypothetical protein HON47_03000 [Candidatus Diapherotrites archaeon]|jgi:hypothetical protein|uniref:Uncharacterized protein n=1 Tax=Candidatus Iainarchaeum sp. TaxID=3101447 RepID=A0A8T5GG86_9ARCH|nr:hypothetical protein [Candidatus Diapherotrites archaeon]MBT7241185.1 hypothetical protein [Candidatus Diapherotrites archaeon]
MTFNNSILLIIKQNNGIDYNDLFARTSSRYKNRSSANSALSRALKNQISFGLIKNEGNRYFITDKGLASISIEMKEKLVLKLNENMKNPLNNLEEIVQLLIVLSQRSSLDNDLLINAKESASFTISDIEDIRKKITKEKTFLKKMDSLIKKQEEKLKELDFNDSKEVSFDEEFAKKLIALANGQKIVFEIKDKELAEKIPFSNKKVSEIIVEGENIEKIFEILLENKLYEIIIYLPRIKVRISRGKAKVFSSYELLKKFFEN